MKIDLVVSTLTTRSAGQRGPTNWSPSGVGPGAISDAGLSSPLSTNTRTEVAVGQEEGCRRAASPPCRVPPPSCRFGPSAVQTNRRIGWLRFAAAKRKQGLGARCAPVTPGLAGSRLRATNWVLVELGANQIRGVPAADAVLQRAHTSEAQIHRSVARVWSGMRTRVPPDLG